MSEQSQFDPNAALAAEAQHARSGESLGAALEQIKFTAEQEASAKTELANAVIDLEVAQKQIEKFGAGKFIVESAAGALKKLGGWLEKRAVVVAGKAEKSKQNKEAHMAKIQGINEGLGDKGVKSATRAAIAEFTKEHYNGDTMGPSVLNRGADALRAIGRFGKERVQMPYERAWAKFDAAAEVKREARQQNYTDGAAALNQMADAIQVKLQENQDKRKGMLQGRIDSATASRSNAVDQMGFASQRAKLAQETSLGIGALGRQDVMSQSVDDIAGQQAAVNSSVDRMVQQPGQSGSENPSNI